MKIKDLKRENFIINENIPKNKNDFIGGKTNSSKNHTYLISEFAKFSQKNDQFILLILGDGEKKMS